MYLAKITFGPTDAERREEDEHLIGGFLAFLCKYGHIDKDYSYIRQGGDLVSYVNVYGPDALADHRIETFSHLSGAYEKVRDRFSETLSFENLDDDLPFHEPDWKKAKFFVLQTDFLSEEPPLLINGGSTRVPLYLIPGTDNEHEYLMTSWVSSYRAVDELWIQSGALEMEAYRQLSDPESELSQSGREHCRYIEAQTGIPTYYSIHRYYGPEARDEPIVCPACGNITRPIGEEAGEDAYLKWLCDDCRLAYPAPVEAAP